MPLALFGINNDALNLTVNLLLLFLVVVWLALVAWTYFDARRRLQDDVLVWCAVGSSLLFPYVGTIIYSILRPPEFLEDRHERELEIRAAELRVKQLTELSCPKCDYPIEKSYLRCPNCQSRVKDPCPSCDKPVDPRWSMCPYCETPVRREPAKRRAPERRPSREPQRERERPARPAPRPKSGSASKQRSAPQREKAASGETSSGKRTSSRKAASPSARRSSGGRAAEPASEDSPADRRSSADAAGEERPRPAATS